MNSFCCLLFSVQEPRDNDLEFRKFPGWRIHPQLQSPGPWRDHVFWRRVFQLPGLPSHRLRGLITSSSIACQWALLVYIFAQLLSLNKLTVISVDKNATWIQFLEKDYIKTLNLLKRNFFLMNNYPAAIMRNNGRNQRPHYLLYCSNKEECIRGFVPLGNVKL